MTGGGLEVVLDGWARPEFELSGPVRLASGPVVISQYAMERITLNEVRRFAGLLPVPGGGILYRDYLMDQNRKGYRI